MLKKKKEQNKIKRRLKRSIHIETVICSFAIFFFFFKRTTCYLVLLFFFLMTYLGEGTGEKMTTKVVFKVTFFFMSFKKFISKKKTYNFCCCFSQLYNKKKNSFLWHLFNDWLLGCLSFPSFSLKWKNFNQVI